MDDWTRLVNGEPTWWGDNCTHDATAYWTHKGNDRWEPDNQYTRVERYASSYRNYLATLSPEQQEFHRDHPGLMAMSSWRHLEDLTERLLALFNEVSRVYDAIEQDQGSGRVHEGGDQYNVAGTEARDGVG